MSSDGIQADSGRVHAVVMRRDTPPQILARHSCAWCGLRLSDVRRDGCGAIYSDSREACERDGWAKKLGDA
jgi:hypothetical protein